MTFQGEGKIKFKSTGSTEVRKLSRLAERLLLLGMKDEYPEDSNKKFPANETSIFSQKTGQNSALTNPS